VTSEAAAGDPAARREAAHVRGARAARARAAVVAAVVASDVALAMWEAGSAAFGRADDASDLDLGIVCAPDAGTQVLDELELALRAVEPDLDRLDIGVSPFGVQRFWQPAGDPETAPICMVDATVIEHEAQADSWRELLTPERHGRALVLHDPDGLLVVPDFDADAHRARLTTELARIRDRRAMFGGMATKELARGREVDAHWMYQRMLAEPLVTLLGMVHRPLRFDFSRRYLHDELPEHVVECLAPLLAPGIGQLPEAADAALAWTDRLLDELDPATLPIEQHAAQMRAAFGA
jgi:predicted nucleotidyltransferase